MIAIRWVKTFKLLVLFEWIWMNERERETENEWEKRVWVSEKRG
jgi:hypothetical protein